MEFSLGDTTVATAVMGAGKIGRLEIRKGDARARENRTHLRMAVDPCPASQRQDLERLSVLYLRHSPYAELLSPQVKAWMFQSLGRDAPPDGETFEILAAVSEASERGILVRSDLRVPEPDQSVVEATLDALVSEWTAAPGALHLTADAIPMDLESEFVSQAVDALKQALPGHVIAVMEADDLAGITGVPAEGAPRVAIRIADRYYDATCTRGTANPARLGQSPDPDAADDIDFLVEMEDESPAFAFG